MTTFLSASPGAVTGGAVAHPSPPAINSDTPAKNPDFLSMVVETHGSIGRSTPKLRRRARRWAEAPPLLVHHLLHDLPAGVRAELAGRAIEPGPQRRIPHQLNAHPGGDRGLHRAGGGAAEGDPAGVVDGEVVGH